MTYDSADHSHKVVFERFSLQTSKVCSAEVAAPLFEEVEVRFIHSDEHGHDRESNSRVDDIIDLLIIEIAHTYWLS